MALKQLLKYKHNNVLLRSGYVYSFSYIPYQNDPKPLIIFLNAITGINPKTGHQWRLIQGINLHYLPRHNRVLFGSEWQLFFEKSKYNVRLTWQLIKHKYPYIEIGIRRYNLKPNYYIKNLKEIEPKNMKKEIQGSLIKDFSIKKLMDLGKKLRRKTGTKR